MTPFELVEPRSLADAFDLLHPSDPAVRPMGGGTALMLMMKAQLFKPTRLVSLRRLGPPFVGLCVDHENSFVRIGAMTTFSELEHSQEIRVHLPVVAATMRTLANVRVRNVATIGGNLAHGDPHLDLPPVWNALDAKALIIGRDSERLVPVQDISAGYYETTIADGELIAELRVPLRPRWKSTYIKVTTRAAHDWPTIGLAVSLVVVQERIQDIRIVLSAAVDKPTRLMAAEEALRGNHVDTETLAVVGDAAVEETELESDNRGSSEYKQQLLRAYLARAVLAVAGAGG